jgi:hypothetical protein
MMAQFWVTDMKGIIICIITIDFAGEGVVNHTLILINNPFPKVA